MIKPLSHIKSRKWLQRIILPGFEGVPLSDVIKFIVNGFGRGVLVTRASSIAFNMLIIRLEALHYLKKDIVYYLIMFLKWIVIVLLLFLAISFLYWLAPAKRSDFRFISPGSIIATFLFILTSLGFSGYVNHFGQYNKLYGSIGTLIVILIWLYLNSIALLIGFELNVKYKGSAL